MLPSRFSIRRFQILTVWVFMCWLSGIPNAVAQGDKYDIPAVEESIFDEEALGMMEFERKKLAEHLAAYVVNHLGKNVVEKKDPKAIQLAERINGIALHLDPRNRVALVSDFQFRRNVAPKPVAEDYEPSVLAAFLETRAGVLAKATGDDNLRLAGYLLSLAVEIDPENEAAVYQLLLWQRAGNKLNWETIVGP